MSRLTVLVLGLLVGLVAAERVRYDNYSLYKITPRTATHIEILKQLEETSDSVNFFEPVVAVGKDVSVLAAPHKQPELLDLLNYNSFEYELLNNNFQNVLDAEQAEMAQKSRAGIYDWTSYHSLTETHDWLHSLAAQYSDRLELIVAGTSYEGRELLGVKLSYSSGRKAVFIEGGIHAREWISPATITYILNQFLTSQDPAVRSLAERYDWYIVPHVNPDGFVYSQSRDRLWRKTRSKGLLCSGTDANRNWGFHWKEVGASSLECSDTFAGKSAFSEIETKSLSAFVASLKDNLQTYLSFHSYSQLMLFPYGHTSSKAPNHNDLMAVAQAAATALARRYGTKYTYGNTYDAIYPAAGSSVDWAYGTLGVKLAYTYELRPGSSTSNGFVLPADQIIPTGQETLDSLVAFFAKAEELGY